MPVLVRIFRFLEMDELVWGNFTVYLIKTLQSEAWPCPCPCVPTPVIAWTQRLAKVVAPCRDTLIFPWEGMKSNPSDFTTNGLPSGHRRNFLNGKSFFEMEVFPLMAPWKSFFDTCSFSWKQSFVETWSLSHHSELAPNPIEKCIDKWWDFPLRHVSMTGKYSPSPSHGRSVKLD